MDSTIVWFESDEPEYPIGTAVEIWFTIEPQLVEEWDEIVLYEVRYDYGLASSPTRVRKRVKHFSQSHTGKVRRMVFLSHELPRDYIDTTYQWVYVHKSTGSHKYEQYGRSHPFTFYCED